MRVSINKKYMCSAFSQGCGEIDCCRCLPDATLLVGDRDDTGPLGMWELSARYLVKGEVLGLELLRVYASTSILTRYSERAPYLSVSSGDESQPQQWFRHRE